MSLALPHPGPRKNAIEFAYAYIIAQWGPGENMARVNDETGKYGN